MRLRRLGFICLIFLLSHANAQEKELSFINGRSNVNLKFRAADSLYQRYLDNDLVKASAMAGKLYELSKEVGTRRASIKALHAMSLVTAYQGDYSGSLRFGQSQLDQSILEKDSAMIMVGYINQGDNYLELGRFDQAYFNTYKAQEIAVLTKSPLDEAYAIHNFGRIFKELGQYDMAVKNFLRSDSMSRALNDIQSPFYTSWEMGNLYQRQGRTDLAYANLKQALKLSRDLKIRVMQPDVQLDLAKYFTEQNQFDAALQYYDSALGLLSAFKNRLGMAKVQLGYGRVKVRQGRLGEAKDHFKDALDEAMALNAKSLQIQAYEELSGIAEREGDFRKSLDYFKKYTGLRDSLFSRELIDQTFRYQLQFLVDTKDNEINALNQVNQLRTAELSRQHLLRNIIVVVFILTIVLLYMVYRSNRKKQQLNKLLISHQAELERRSQELEEINFLKDKFFSIISHDLRSPINSLAGVLNLMEKNGVTPQELPILTKELRMQFNHTKNLITNLLSWAMLQMDKVTVKKEMVDLYKVVDENFTLASSMTTKKMTLVNDVPKGTNWSADLNMIHLIIRNLVMNAIKFTDPGGQVRVSTENRGTDMVIMVEDTGVGMSPEIQKLLLTKEAVNYTTRGTMNEKGTGLGLSLCREFIELLGGKMWLHSTEGKGTTFYISLPSK